MRITILTVLTMLLCAASAQATTYCVGDYSNCTGSAATDLQDALDKAKAHAGADVVHLGKGTYTTAAGFAYDQAGVAENDVQIEGEGNATVLKADTATKTNGFRVLTLTGAAGGALDTFVDMLRIQAPAYGGGAAVAGVALTNASAEYVDVDGTPTWGAILNLGGRMRFGTVAAGNGVLVQQHDAKLEDYAITGENGVRVSGSGSLAAARLDITSTADAVGCFDCDGVSVESSVLRIGLTGTGINASATSGMATASASHLTVFGSVSNSGRTATAIRSVTTGAGDAAVSVDNSIFAAVTRAYDRSAGNAGGDAELTAFNNNYTVEANASAGPGQLTETGRTNLVTGFVAPLSGDLHLGPKANQIDKGRATPFLPGLGVDADLLERAVGPRDQGAYEYPKHAPMAIWIAPTGAETGVETALSGANSGDGGDPGDNVVAHKWSFGDGTTATGSEVKHAWAAPGTYQVTLEVTDLEGQTDATVHAVVVTTPAQPQPVVEPTADPAATPAATPSATPAATPAATPVAAPVPAPGTAPADTAAPVLRSLRFRKAALRWSVGEAATLQISVRKGRRTVKRSRLAVKAGAGKAALKLKPGRYTVTVVAVDGAGNRSAPARIRVTGRR